MMLTTIDGRKIRARKGLSFELVEMTRDGRHAILNEVRDGVTYAGPTVTAAEWHAYNGNSWVRCSGSNRVPAERYANEQGWYYSSGLCAECGNGVQLRNSDRLVALHKRPAGQRFDAEGVQVAIVGRS